MSDSVIREEASAASVVRIDGTARPGDEIVPGPEFAVIVPTFCERDNVGEVYRRIKLQLAGIDWELVFVDDDSTDGTAPAVAELAGRDRRVRLLRRVGRRGLSSACIEGILATSAPYLAVMDADLQHDERLLPAMLDRARAGADLVIGSRYMAGADFAALPPPRQRISDLASRMAGLVLRQEVSDPMSGFFALPRATFEAALPKLTGRGFKILLDLLVSSPRRLDLVELPYTFGVRRHGQSKLDSQVALEFAELILDKWFGRHVPVRFLMFATVGGIGLVLHLAVLWAALNLAGLAFAAAQAIATVTAMTSNFFLNNQLTYRDRRLRGWAMAQGLVSFYAICAVGAVANVGVGTLVYAEQPWWLLAGAAGALVGAGWNFAVSSIYTWQKR